MQVVNLKNFDDSPNVSTSVDDKTANNEDVKKCKSDTSDYDCVPVDDLIFPVVEESIKTSEDDKTADLEVTVDGASVQVNNSDVNFIVETMPELPLALPQIDDYVEIEEFVQCKTEEELVTMHDPARDVVVPCVLEPSGGLQIAKVKNEDGEEVKLFTNINGVYEIVPDFDSHASSLPIASPTLENLTCPECKVAFDKLWKLNRHQRNPWLDRSERQNQKRR